MLLASACGSPFCRSDPSRCARRVPAALHTRNTADRGSYSLRGKFVYRIYVRAQADLDISIVLPVAFLM